MNSLPLHSELAGDPDLAELLIDFVGLLPARAAAMAQALESGELHVLATLAHHLTGSAGGYGFPTITAAARALENGARACAPLPALHEQLAELAELCGRATAAEPPS